MDEVDRLIDDAMRFEENEDYLSAYDKWEEFKAAMAIVEEELVSEIDGAISL